MGDKFLKFAAFVIIIAALFAWAASCRAGECYECLTRAGDWTDKWEPGVKVKGDIIACKPAGGEWGTKERDTKKYKIVTFCDIKPEEVDALQDFDRDAEREPLNTKRFKAIIVDEKPLITDKKTSMAVTPADAKAVVDSYSKDKKP